MKLTEKFEILNIRPRPDIRPAGYPVSGFFKKNNVWRELSEELHSLKNYLKYTWVGNPIRNSGRLKPLLFAHAICNLYEKSKDENFVTTTNALESLNRTLNNLMGHLPNIWNVIQGFINQETETKIC